MKNQTTTARIKQTTHFKIDGVRRKRKLKTFEAALEYLIQLGLKTDKSLQQTLPADRIDFLKSFKLGTISIANNTETPTNQLTK